MTYYKAFNKEMVSYGGNNQQVNWKVGEVYDINQCDENLFVNATLYINSYFSDNIEDLYKIFLKEGSSKFFNRICEVEPLDEIRPACKEYEHVVKSNKFKLVREITGEEFDYLTGNGSNESLMKRFHELYDNKKLNRLKVVQVGIKYNFSDGQGSVVSPNLWFDGIDVDFENDILLVWLKNSYSRITFDDDGKINFGKWKDVSTIS